jgi:hypothetical protein
MNTTGQPQDLTKRHSTAEVIGGFAIGVGLIIICTGLLGTAGVTLARYFRTFASFGLWSVLAFGVTQLVYMVPAIIIARRSGRMGIAKGLIIAASLAFLLNASCFVLFWSGKMGRIAG